MQKNIVLLIVSAAAAALFSNVSQAATFTSVSRAGDTLTLEFTDDVVTTASSEAVLCNSRNLMLMKAELWMPSMGHGSSPVALYPQANGCTAIRSMNFMMRGDWEVRVRLQNNDTGKFSFNVIEAR
ncbi:MAG: YtkA-like [Pseudomonadota bacterium]|jgi:hypothetical protein